MDVKRENVNELIRSYFLQHNLSFEQGMMKALNFMAEYEYEDFVEKLFDETKGVDDVQIYM